MSDTETDSRPGPGPVSHRADAQPSPAGDGRANAKPPIAAAAVAPLGALFALLLLAAGVVGVRDGLAAAGALGGTPWIASAIKHVNGLTPRTWMLFAGIAAVLVGLWWVVVALKPRRRTAVQLRAGTSVWMRPADLARVATAAAEDVPAVESVSSSAKRTSVTLKVRTLARDSSEIRGQVEEVVAARLQSVAKMPRVKVRVRTSGESR